MELTESFANGHYQIPDSEYRKVDAYSRSDLEIIRKKSIQHYRDSKLNPIEPTPQMLFGQFFHSLILEPDLFYQWHITNLDKPVMPEFSRSKADLLLKEQWRNTVYHQWEKSVEGKILIKQDDWTKLHSMRDSLMSNPILNGIITNPNTKFETSWFYEENGLKFKAKTDIFFPEHGIIVDIKTTQDASFTSFRRDVANYSLDVQASFYIDIVSKVLKTNKITYLLAVVEKNSPYGVAIYKLNDPAIEVGRELYQRGIAKIKDAENNQCYPETIVDLDLPAYAYDLESR